MSLADDYGHFVLLGVGLAALAVASKRKPRKLEDRTGEECDPDDPPPFGYECGQVRGGWALRPEREHFVGFGPYLNRGAVDEALASLGFPGGQLADFQRYMAQVYDRDLRQDGVVDGPSMRALVEAESMLARDEWVPPRTLG